MTSDPHRHRLLLFGGQTQTTTAPECSTPLRPGRACTGTASPVQTLSDTWAFNNRVWRRLASGGAVPQSGRLLSYDPDLETVVLVGQTLVNTPRGVPGTWRWTPHRWTLLSPTGPTTADTMGYDPISHRLLAFGGQEPFTPGPGMGVASTPGYARTWAFTGRRWSEFHPLTLPDRAPGVLTASPDGHRLLLINTHGHVWTWTGRDWQPHPTRGAPTGGNRSWIGATPSAATDLVRHQIVLLIAGGNTDDETWTLQGDRWTRYPTP